ncbi:DMT family transporter [bacterium]|nr:DMT family transporter [bacterium]
MTIPLAIIACLLWSTAFVGIKIGLRHSPPWFFAGTRFLLSGLILIPFSGGFRHLFSDLKHHYKTVLLVALLHTFLLYGFFYIGMTMVEGALAAIIVGASPLVSAVMAHIFMKSDRLTRIKVLSLMSGFSGVIIISLSRAPWSATGFRDTLGILLLLTGSTCAAGANIVVAKSNKSLPPLRLSSLQFTLGGSGLIILSLLTETWPSLPLPAEYWVTFSWLSIMSAIAMSIWFILLKRPGVKVSELNLWKFIMPVFGAILAWALLPDESPSVLPIAGMIIVAASILGFYRSAIDNKNN